MMHNAKRTILSVIACTLSVGAMAAESQNEGRTVPEDAIVIGQGVVCDSAQQIKHFATLLEGASVEDAVNIVNQEADNPIACAAVMAAFVPGKDVDEVDREGRSLRIVEITIIAVPLNGQWHVVSPTKQYAAFPLKGMEI
jgi:hypothetical protein